VSPAPSAEFFERAVLAIARENGARTAAAELPAILRRLPCGGAEGRQTADVSFSSAGPGAVRFSVNDSLRRGALGTFAPWLEKSLGAGYDLKAVSEFLKLGKALKGGFQTTAALEWPAGLVVPVLKLYLEEAPGLGSAFADRGFRGRVRALAGGGRGVKAAPAPEIIALDLFPGGATDLKLYFRRDSLPAAGLTRQQRAAMRSLDREARGFYYEMKRLSCGGSKIYKVYEPGCAGDPAAAVAEICALYAKLGLPRGVGFVSSCLKLARRAGLRLLPTLCGAGVSSGGKLKVDSYFRFVK